MVLKYRLMKDTRYLTGLRYETDAGKFDVLDHLASMPLSFANQARAYLEYKKRQKLATFRAVERYINRTAAFFGDQNVKHIKKKEVIQTNKKGAPKAHHFRTTKNRGVFKTL